MADTNSQVEKSAPAAAPAEPYYCRCCGEECESGRDCCSDDFAEPGEMRETGR